MAKTIRVAPTIEETTNNTLKCFNITPKQALENYSDSLIYGNEIAYQLKYLKQSKDFYQNIIENANKELEKINEQIEVLEQQKKNIDAEMEENILKAQDEVSVFLNNSWDAVNSPTYKKATLYKIEDMQAIADKYKVPLKRIFKKEPCKGFYKATLKNYKKIVPASLLFVQK